MSGIVGNNTNRGSGLVKSAAVGADSIDGSNIADDAIDSEHYAAGSIDEAHIADNAVSLDKMAGGTDGNIISYDASGDPVAIATGNDGQVLTSTGAGSPPAFEDAGGGGADSFKVYASATQSINSDSTTKLTFNTESWDIGGTFDNATNYRYTPGVAGVYLLGAVCQYQGFADRKSFKMYFYKNDSALTGWSNTNQRMSVSGTDSLAHSYLAIVESDADDYFEVFVRHDTGGALNVGANRGFFGYKIGETA